MAKALLLILAVGLMGCESSLEREYHQGTGQESKGQHALALSSFDQVIARDPDSTFGLKAAREGARISLLETKDYKKSVSYNESVVFHSPDPEERLKAQKQISTIYMEHLNNYAQAIIELNKLIPLLQDPTEKTKYKMDLARAYYYQNNFYQAEMETDEFLRSSQNEDQIFQMKLLKANIALARKDLAGATQILKEVIRENPKMALKENVGLSLAVAYEEMNDYKAAILTLQGIRDSHPIPEYIDLRIKKLQERLKNQPGARGLRK